MTLQPSEIAAAYEAACLAELDAPKPGNVHRFAPGHRMSVADFETSARVSAPFVADAGLGVGARILKGVEATFAAVGQNTNLGILLLAAPLAAAAEKTGLSSVRETGCGALRRGLSGVLADLGPQDADDVFRAIALAAPGGLGAHAEHDVRAPATISLLGAMRIAAPRDRIAHQYACGFGDIFDIGVPAYTSSKVSGEMGIWPVLRCFFAFSTRFADSHVVRKFGQAAGDDLLGRMNDVYRRLNFKDNQADSLALLLAFDEQMKAEGLNPGTSADLTVAGVLAAELGARLEDCGPG